MIFLIILFVLTSNVSAEPIEKRDRIGKFTFSGKERENYIHIPNTEVYCWATADWHEKSQPYECVAKGKNKEVIIEFDGNGNIK